MALFIQNHVVWLQISVNNVMPMQLFESKQDFTDVDSGFVLIESLLYLQVLTQVASRAILQNQEEFSSGLESEVELDYERMADHTHDVSFSHGISGESILLDLVLGQHFHGMQGAVTYLLHEVHLSKTPRPQQFMRSETVSSYQFSRFCFCRLLSFCIEVSFNNVLLCFGLLVLGV